MAQSHSNAVTLLSAIVLYLCLPAVLGTPFIVTARREDEFHDKQQVTLQNVDYHGSTGKHTYHGDPLKDFISDVVHDSGSMFNGNDNNEKHGDKIDGGRTVVPVTPPSSLRYAVDGLDNITIGMNRIADLPSIDKDVESTLRRPSWFDSVLMARRLLAKSSVGIASTVYQHSDSSSAPIAYHHAPQPAGLQGVSISLPEYIADCSEVDGNNGNPILLGLYVSTTFQNIAKGSNISLSIDWWSHVKDTDPVYPGFPLSEAGLPRISMLGYVERLDLSSATSSATKEGLEECFFATHPDAKVWAPRNPDSPHSGFWARMVVTQVYWVGGFGDLQQIGWVNVTDWKGVGRYESDESIGDGSGRGWEDVRLPGE
ncbi:hypothetical protein TMatcc_001581 [Talaromyces marneffei ATCC 18224]|uniref:uncharacterized protein n=1 Tax=Talaromyces marneffei TaxID=37727 RepID=UPI0012A970C7|nr:uncharacterized protein EYB26_007203 [Talaromyces marneffei]QGA19514.1 hypothetical protein EYB26_007203 [Talaromyces marneffei]